MRLLIVHNSYRSQNPSGENRVVELESELLRAAGHEVLTYVRSSDEIAHLPLAGKAAVPARVVWSRQDRRALRDVIKRSAPDVVHLHNTFPLISASAIAACEDVGVPAIATLHNFRLMCANGLLLRDGVPCQRCVGRVPWAAVRYGCYRQSRAASLPVALSIQIHRSLGTWTQGVSGFITLTEFARKMFIAAGLPADRIHVKPNSVPRATNPRRGPGKHILFLGRLSHEKGVDLLVDAWSEDLPPLVVAGDGPLQTELIEKLRTVGNGVTLLGQLPYAACMELLRDARMLVVPSRCLEGGVPLVVAEAYAHGVPVIAPDLGSFREMVLNGRTGFLFSPGSAKDLALGIEAISDPLVSVRMGTEAHRLYEEHYTPERNLEQLLQIYRSVAHRGIA